MKFKMFEKTMKSLLLALFASSALVFTSCDDDDDDDNNQTITEVVINGSNFTLLEAAVVRAGLADALAQGSLTVFAPTDAAFQAAGFADVAAINNTPVATLQAVLQYHVLATKVEAAAIPTADNTAQTTLGGGTIYITKNASGVSVNGARVTQADVAASNGVIHVIDKVLLPPAGNIVQTAQASADLTFLVAAVTRANLGNTLSTTNPLTVFAPTNAAFQAAGFPTIQSVQNADVATLTSILTYHVVGARAFSTNLTNGSDVNTLANKTVRINITGNAVTVLGKGNNNNASNVIGANIVATNGVVHVIDRVLLP